MGARPLCRLIHFSPSAPFMSEKGPLILRASFRVWAQYWAVSECQDDGRGLLLLLFLLATRGLPGCVVGCGSSMRHWWEAGRGSRPSRERPYACGVASAFGPGSQPPGDVLPTIEALAPSSWRVRGRPCAHEVKVCLEPGPAETVEGGTGGMRHGGHIYSCAHKIFLFLVTRSLSLVGRRD